MEKERKYTGTLYEFISEACKNIWEVAREAPVYPEDIVIEAKVYPIVEYFKDENGAEEPRLSINVPRLKEDISCNTFSTVKVRFNVWPS
jgi:hypothetical protein